jgi:hypothetical protein
MSMSVKISPNRRVSISDWESCSGLQGTDHWQFRLLRACRERPCGSRAAEQRDEIPPPHFFAPA